MPVALLLADIQEMHCDYSWFLLAAAIVLVRVEERLYLFDLLWKLLDRDIGSVVFGRQDSLLRAEIEFQCAGLVCQVSIFITDALQINGKGALSWGLCRYSGRT